MKILNKHYIYTSISIYNWITNISFIIFILSILLIASGIYKYCINDINFGLLSLTIYLYLFFGFHFLILPIIVIISFFEKKIAQYIINKKQLTDIKFFNKKQCISFFITIFIALLTNIFIYSIKDALFRAFD